MKHGRHRLARSREADVKQATDYVGLIVLALSSGGYAAVYSFRAGQASYFGLPAELLSLDLKDVVAGGIALSIVILSVVFVGNSLMQLIEGELPYEIESRLKGLVVSTLFFATFVYLLGAPAAWYYSIVIAAVTFAFMQFVLPLFTQRGVPGYVEKLNADTADKRSSTPSPLTRFALKRPQLFLPALAFGLVLLLAEPVGVYTARTRVSYAVIPGAPERVVVAEYRGSFVTLELDRETSTLMPPIMVTRPEDVSEGLRVERLGPIQLQKDE